MEEQTQPEQAIPVQEGSVEALSPEGDTNVPSAEPEPSGPKPWTFNGMIPFTLKVHFDGKWDVNYKSGLENEIAAVAITKFVAEMNMNECNRRMALDKKPTKTEDKLTKEQNDILKKAFKVYSNVVSSTDVLLNQLKNMYTKKVAAQQKESVEKESFEQSQPEQESSGTREENIPNEIHQDK